MKKFLSLSLAIALAFAIVPAFSTSAQAAVEIPPEGLVIFNKDSIEITVSKINRDKDGYVTDIDFFIANNSGEEKSVSTVPNIWSVVKINNLTFKAHLSAKVAAGKMAREKLRLNDNDVKLFDLKDVFEITMQFQTYDSEGYMMKNIVAYEPSTLTISSEKHNDFNKGTLVFSDSHADIYSCGFESGFFSNEAVFVVKNKTNKDIKFCFSSLSTNGIMNKDDEVSESIYKETYRVFRILLDDEFDIDNVYEVEFILKSEKFLELFSFDQETISLVMVKY